MGRRELRSRAHCRSGGRCHPSVCRSLAPAAVRLPHSVEQRVDRKPARSSLRAQRLQRHHRGAGPEARRDALLPERAPALSSSPLPPLLAGARRAVGQRGQPDRSGAADAASVAPVTGSRASIRAVDLGFALLLAPLWAPLLLLASLGALLQGTPIFYCANGLVQNGRP